jgi:hypothetical protein
VNTVGELTAVLGKTESIVIVKEMDRGGIFVYEAKKSDVNNGGTVFNGWVRQYSGAINVKWFGAKGDGVTDDTDAIQKALYLYGNGNTLGSVYSKKKLVTIFFPLGKYRITKRIHQPSASRVIGSSVQTPNPTRIGEGNGCIIYVDFKDPNQTAWLVGCFARKGYKGLKDNELIDPFKYGSNGKAYDSRKFSRNMQVAIENIAFVTHNEVTAGICVMAAPDIVLKVSTYGFLHGVLVYSCWSANLEIYGLSYLSGVFLYNVNGTNLKGYVGAFRKKSEKSLKEYTPKGWQDYSCKGYSGNDRYWTTGVYAAYCHAMTLNSMVVEKFERGKMFYNCEGVTDNSPYNEFIPKVGYHNINSTITVNSPQFYGVPYCTQTGSKGSITLNIGKDNNQIISKFNSAKSRVLAVLNDFSDIHKNEPYNAAVQFDTVLREDPKIYMDETAGNNKNTGLNKKNAVADLDTAKKRAKYYKAKIIVTHNGDVLILK